MSESKKAYLASAIVCAIVWGAILTYAWYRNQDAITVSTERMSADQIERLNSWME